uniref:Ig-like domain-containing protein n=3 Tax=Cyprinus carpio TaxID=7962 RepID=A0A8C1JTA7_CYPCA
MTNRACIVFMVVLKYGCFGEDTVNQPNENITAVEGQQVSINCEFKTLQLTPYLYWYIQRSNAPEYVLMRYKFGSSNSSEFEKRFDARLDSNSVPLTIKNLRVSDSSVYYCALQPTVTDTPPNIAQKHDTVISNISYMSVIPQKSIKILL